MTLLAQNFNLLSVGTERKALDSHADFHVAESTHDFHRVEKACRGLAESEGLKVVGVLSRSSGPAVISASRADYSNLL